jgi:3-hydroxyacyl-CoA dehydrogenase
MGGADRDPAELMAFLQPVFMNIATAKVSKSAAEAVGYGFARATDTVLFHPDELLYVAIREARALAESGYAPPPRRVPCRWPGAAASRPWR